MAPYKAKKSEKDMNAALGFNMEGKDGPLLACIDSFTFARKLTPWLVTPLGSNNSDRELGSVVCALAHRLQSPSLTSSVGIMSRIYERPIGYVQL
jgi:hypothetical protein